MKIEQLSTAEKRALEEWIAGGVPAADIESVNNVLYASENIASLPSISSALDTAEANAPATVAVVDPGTHTVSIVENDAALYWDTDNVHLYVGAGVTIQMADNEHSGPAGHVVRVGDGTTAVNDVRVYGPGTIDGNKANNSSTDVGASTGVLIDSQGENCWVRDLNIENTPGGALHFSGSASPNMLDESGASNITLRSVHEGILFFNCDGFQLRDFEVYGTDRGDGVEPTANSVNWTVVNGHIEDTNQQGVDVFDGASDGEVRDVTVVSSGANSFDVSDTATASDGVTFVNCESRGSGDKGYSVKTAGGHTNIRFVECDTVNPTNQGMRVPGGGCEVAGGSVEGAGASGISVPSGTPAGVFIKGITLVDNNPGGLAQLTCSHDNDDLYIVDVTLSHSGAAPSNAIYIDGAQSGKAVLNTGQSGDHTNDVTATNTGANFTATPNYF